MPYLDWIGKDKIVNHHLYVPFHILNEIYTYNNKESSDNKIIHGDNLIVLKSLLPEYEKKIKCIYIDPPYNTGNEEWKYNDKVNDPQIREWFNQTVGKEGEDLSRHDKWLCMMYPRLKILQRLLSEDGVLVISIGYHEITNLLQMCGEIFSDKQIMVATVQTSGGKPSNGFIITHEYIVFITPKDFNPNVSQTAMNNYSSPYHGMNLATFNQVQRPNQTYPIYINTKDGTIHSTGKSLEDLIKSGEYVGNAENFIFDYESAPPGTVAVWPVTDKGMPCVWRLKASRLESDWNKGYIKVVPHKSKKNRNQYSVQYLADGIIKKIENGEFSTYKISTDKRIPTIDVVNFKSGGVGIPTIWIDKKYYTDKGSNLITDIFGDKKAFNYSKPIDLVVSILSRVTDKDSIILDSFAGSGTTAHAVLTLNKLDGGKRKFILVEKMDYANSITAERVKRVIDGYTSTGKKSNIIYDREITIKDLTPEDITKIMDEANDVYDNAKLEYEKVSKPKVENGHLQIIATETSDNVVEGTGGDFTYYELGECIFTNDGELNENIPIESIREYIYFMETNLELPKGQNKNPYYMGSKDGTSYYFYYNKNIETILNIDFLSNIDNVSDAYIIYADVCNLSDEIKEKYHITFKKIPRDIRHLR